MMLPLFSRYLLFFLVFSVVHTGAQPSVESPLATGVPSYLVASRIEILDRQTPVLLVHNESVQAYIDVYTKKRAGHLAAILGRSEVYFPLFEQYLDKYDLPLELKYLAVIESALEPRAKSSSGAYGLWQFLYQASRMFNLSVTTYVDERADPALSTDAACRYLKYLHDNFNDWLLAIAAYNGGIGEVKEAIRRSGGETDYWKLRPFLSEQVQGYVPAFIAAIYAMNHYQSYDITPEAPPYKFDELVIAAVPGGISFKQIASKTSLNIETLSLLNPSYKQNYIPLNDEEVRIVIPGQFESLFIANRDKWKTETFPPADKPTPLGDVRGRVKDLHKVAPGEFFHKIAMDYDCRVEDLMVWNNLKDKDIMAGQILVIWKPVVVKDWK